MISKELINKGKEILLNDKSEPGVNNQFFNIISEENKVNILQGPFVCYAETKRIIKNKNKIMIDKSVCKEDLKHHKRYLNYCLNESFFSDPFITKDVEEVIELGGTILDVSYSGPEVISAAIIVRFISETPSKIILWEKLIDEGVKKDVAAILMLFYNLYGSNITINSMNFGHSWLNIHKTENFILLFKNALARNKNKLESFNISKNYLPTDSIYFKNIKENLDGGFIYYLDEYKIPEFIYRGDTETFKNSLGRRKKTDKIIKISDAMKLQEHFLNFIGD